MCYRFTTPLRRRPAHGFAFQQAETLDAFAGSSFSAATRATGLASEERSQSPGSRFRVTAGGKNGGIGMFPNPAICGVGKGTRTLDTRNHNPVL